MTPEQAKYLQDYQDIIEQFRKEKPTLYDEQGQLIPDMLGPSEMEGVSTDPAYKEHELAALRALEEQSREGFTAADKAAMARTETETNRAHRGRVGAIQQNMAARGASGSGMDLVAQMQSAQDANEIAAMRALEREGLMQERKSEATRDLGAMSTNLQSRDFAQQAAKARAADQIKQFNVQNSNSAQAANLANKQNVANMNVDAANNQMTAGFNAGLQGAQMGYNAATDDENRKLLEKQEEERKKAAKKAALGQAIGGGVGAVGGGIFGGPAGAAVGAGVGSSLGGAAASYFPSDERVKNDVKPEHEANIEAFLALLDPKSFTYEGDGKQRHGVLAQDLERSVIGRDMVVEDENGVKNISVPDAISGLLAAVAHLNKKVRR